MAAALVFKCYLGGNVDGQQHIAASFMPQVTATHCNTLHHTASHIAASYMPQAKFLKSQLYCISLVISASRCVAVCCSVLQCVAVCCSVLQCVKVRCSVLQCVADK